MSFFWSKNVPANRYAKIKNSGKSCFIFEDSTLAWGRSFSRSKERVYFGGNTDLNWSKLIGFSTSKAAFPVFKSIWAPFTDPPSINIFDTEETQPSQVIPDMVIFCFILNPFCHIQR